jgi:arabinogalactan endo-1,4-beta-galactosidase
MWARPISARPISANRPFRGRVARPLVSLLGLALAAAALTTAPWAEAASVSLSNPGFESGLAGWTVSGATSAATVATPGRNNAGSRLNLYASGAYNVAVSRQVGGLNAGWWTASAWAKSGTGLSHTTLNLRGCGSGDASAVVPNTEQDDAWVRVAVSAYVTSGSCTLSIATNGSAGAWANLDDVAFETGRVQRGLRGGDISSLAKNEARGAAYASASGVTGNAVSLLAGQGMNLARLKVWVNPADGYNTAAQVVPMAVRAKAAGMKVLIDFHYSDTWADPGKQTVPRAWSGHSPAQLAEDVRAHTASVMTALKNAGVLPDYVQVGNEINPGMLWPWGQTWDVNTSDNVTGAQWDNLASFLKAGASAVKAVSPNSKVILHLTNINNGISGLTWWFDAVTARSVPFDVIGLSYYSYWHGSLASLQSAITTLSGTYNKDVMVVETAYPFTLSDDSPGFANVIGTTDALTRGYPATPASQAAQFRAVQDAVAAAPGGRGLGAVYWEPAWTAVAGSGWDPADPSSGNNWENQAMFDFNNRLLPAAAAFAPDPSGPGPVTTTTTTTTTSPTTTTTASPTTTTTTSKTSNPPTTTTIRSNPATTTTTGGGGRTCTAVYSLVGQWSGGFQGEVRVTAGASSITSWTVVWNFADGQTVTQVWGATTAVTGGTVTATNVSWNGALGSGASTTFGFIGSSGARNGVPTVSCSAA